MINCLLKAMLFEDIPVKHLENIITFCYKLELNDGDVLISENEKAHFDLYILFEGKVEILSI
ncbi:MAG: hypothetical protein ACE5EH_08070 [Gammaproteobacteria bacterium]